MRSLKATKSLKALVNGGVRDLPAPPGCDDAGALDSAQKMGGSVLEDDQPDVARLPPHTSAIPSTVERPYLVPGEAQVVCQVVDRHSALIGDDPDMSCASGDLSGVRAER
jgi:hypothetical protein